MPEVKRTDRHAGWWHVDRLKYLWIPWHTFPLSPSQIGKKKNKSLSLPPLQLVLPASALALTHAQAEYPHRAATVSTAAVLSSLPLVSVCEREREIKPKGAGDGWMEGGEKGTLEKVPLQFWLHLAG